jgi:hypothetical protein
MYQCSVVICIEFNSVVVSSLSYQKGMKELISCRPWLVLVTVSVEKKNYFHVVYILIY